jgi:hypothetical protein
MVAGCFLRLAISRLFYNKLKTRFSCNYGISIYICASKQGRALRTMLKMSAYFFCSQ